MSEIVAKDQLRSFVERIERLAEERKTIADDIADVYAEAHGQGFDKKALKRLISERAKDPSQRAEFNAIFDLYWAALHGEDSLGQVQARAYSEAAE